MTLRAQMKLLTDVYSGLKDLIDHNHELLDIHEGNLLKYIDKDLAAQLSPQSYKACRHRLAPINLLQKIVDKSATIYQPGPARRIEGSAKDKELFDWYVEQMNPNEAMGDAADLMTMCKASLLQPFPHHGKPRLRAIQNDHFFVLSNDKVDPMSPTHVVTFDQCATDAAKVDFRAYTKDEFLAFNSAGEIDVETMMAVDNLDGLNPYGVLPFVYATASRFRLTPTPDSDILTMTKLIPILFTDLNYAVMYQAFSIMYGIDIDDAGIVMAPNAFLRFKSDPNTDKTPELGQIKPQVDIDPVLGLIQTELALWLNSRGIRPGAVGQLSGDNFANGISKMIDEMDTVEARRWLTDIFTKIEAEMWNLVMHKLHPVWVDRGWVEDRGLFSPEAKVEVVFNPQLPMVSRTTQLNDAKLAIDSGLSTRTDELKAMHPLKSDEEIAELERRIDDEKKARAEAFQTPGGEDEDEDEETKDDEGDAA